MERIACMFLTLQFLKFMYGTSVPLKLRDTSASFSYVTLPHPVLKHEQTYYIKSYIIGKGRDFYGQEPRSGDFTTTECGVNYQLLAVITEVAKWGTPSCSRPQPAIDNGVRDGRSN